MPLIPRFCGQQVPQRAKKNVNLQYWFRTEKAIYHANKKTCSVETHVHLELTIIKFHQDHLNVVTDNSMTSVFTVQQKTGSMNSPEKVSKI